MADATVVYMRPVWVGGNAGYRYEVTFEGRVIVERSRVPALDAARWCAGEGKDGILEVWRDGGSGAALKGELSRMARWTVDEGERSGPTFKRWRPFDRSRLVDQT